METIASIRRNERLTGAFFIAATVSAIVGAKLYDPILQNADFWSAAGKASSRIALGAFFELTLAVANIGTGIMLYPLLKRYSESWGLGYALFRLLEVVFILIGVLGMLSIAALSRDAQLLPGRELSALQAAARTLKTIYTWAFILGPHFMLGINTFIYSSIFYRRGLIPRKIAAVGVLGAVLIFAAAVLELFGIISPFSGQLLVLALPIAVYEMVLAGWLIAKGLNQPAYEAA